MEDVSGRLIYDTSGVSTYQAILRIPSSLYSDTTYLTAETTPSVAMATPASITKYSPNSVLYNSLREQYFVIEGDRKFPKYQ